jgi:NADH-quinone oxidoreductase subunit M
MRWVGLIFSFVSLLLCVLVFLAYDPARGGFQFVEQLDWMPQLGISYLLGVDGISLPMLLLNGIVIFTGALMSWNIEKRAKEYWVLLLLLATGVYGVFVALDLFLFFVFYELAVLPMYLLIGVWGSTRKEYGAMKLTLFLMAGSALTIIGMLGLYFSSGLRTFDMLVLAQNVTLDGTLQRILFPCLFVGFAVLAGMFPFHTWSPTGHVAAPTAVSMLHAGVLMKLGAYGCLRAAMWLMPAGAREWLPIIAVLTILNVVYGATIAMAQRDAKYIIGYSSVSHMGLVVMGLAAGTQIALMGSVLQMFAHGVMTALFFAVVGRMIYERTHTRQLPELGGLGRRDALRRSDVHPRRALVDGHARAGRLLGRVQYLHRGLGALPADRGDRGDLDPDHRCLHPARGLAGLLRTGQEPRVPQATEAHLAGVQRRDSFSPPSWSSSGSIRRY